MKYIYWFKQQAVALTFLAISWGIGYIIGSKWLGGTKEIVLTVDYVVILVLDSLLFIFVVPFFFKWWDPANTQ